MQRLTWSLGLKSRSKLSYPESCFKKTAAPRIKLSLTIKGTTATSGHLSSRSKEWWRALWAVFTSESWKSPQVARLQRLTAKSGSRACQGVAPGKGWVCPVSVCLWVPSLEGNYLEKPKYFSGLRTRLNETEFLPGVGRNGKRITVQSLFLKAEILAQTNPKHRHMPSEMKSNPILHLS